MTYSEPTRTTARRIPRILVAGLLVVVAAIAVALGYPLLTSSSSTAASPTVGRRREQPRPQLAPRRAVGAATLPTDVPGGEQPPPQLPPRQAVDEATSPIDVPRGEQPRP